MKSYPPFHYSLHKRLPPPPPLSLSLASFLSHSHIFSLPFSLILGHTLSHFNLIVCALLLSVGLDSQPERVVQSSDVEIILLRCF